MIDATLLHRMEERCWTEEDTNELLYILERILSMTISPSYIDILIKRGLESSFVQQIINEMLNLDFYSYKGIELMKVQKAVGNVLLDAFPD